MTVTRDRAEPARDPVGGEPEPSLPEDDRGRPRRLGLPPQVPAQHQRHRGLGHTGLAGDVVGGDRRGAGVDMIANTY